MPINNPLFQALADAARAGEPVALGIITGAQGSSPQKRGAKAVFYRDGRIQGTLGGGCLEAEVQRRAMQALLTGRPGAFDLVLDHDFGWDDGLICGGRVRVLILPNAQAAGPELWQSLADRTRTRTWGVTEQYAIAVGGAEEGLAAAPGAANWLYEERVTRPCGVWIAGAGHIAKAVAPLALQLDFDVTVLDDRPVLASHSVFPEAVRLEVGAWESLCALPLPDGPVFGLIVTRGHRHDALVLKEWIHRPFAFLGMIGSARKSRMIFDQFIADGLATAEEVSRVACPVGVPIHSQTVPEIAVSIVAQFIQKRAESGV